MINKNHPDAIFIQLHTYCNANCINCPHDFTYKAIHPKGKMSESTWKKILHDLIEMDFRGQIGFYLHHEPLIDVSLFDKINDINHMTNSFVVLSTNGALLNQKNIEKLIASRPKKVHINLNSGVKEEFENSMGLNFETTISNVHNFISQAKDLIEIEINCPVLKGFNVQSLKELFPTVQVNLEFYANSRGGLIPELFSNVEGSRFKLDSYCRQPSQNLNILFDGSVIGCCMDWMHESKNERLNINNTSIVEIYNEVKKLEDSFRIGDYSKYKMCQLCSSEMGFNKNDKGEKLKILLTNHHLLDYTGSEVFTLTLADYLKQNGCEVVVYSRYVDKIEKEFIDLEIPVVYHLEEIKNHKFDIAHVHHNINAAEVRFFFPHLPIVFLSQGVLPFLEQPSVFDLGISHYLAISEEIRNNLISCGINENEISIIGNIINTQKFFPLKPINHLPKRALIISAKISDEKANTIIEACNFLGIDYLFVGGRFGEVKQEQLLKLITDSDIIFSLGRGAIEAMLCARSVIVFDSLGGDGMVTPENFDEIRKHNFSGRRFGKEFSTEDLINETKQYNPSNTQILYKKVFDAYSAEKIVPKLIRTYKQIISSRTIISGTIENKKLEAFYASLQETRTYTTILTQRKSDKPKKEERLQTNKERTNDKADLKVSQLISKIGIYKQNKNEQFLVEHSYDILIPIYNAFDHVKTCVESVLKNTDKKHKVYLLDDASSDARILPLLNGYAHDDNRVIVLPYGKNLGFIGNVNRGFAISNNDVIILNSDTQVTPGWVEKMHRCILSNSSAGIVCPLSNNATILSVPVMNASNKLPKGMSIDDFADLVAKASKLSYPELPTAVGFCMMIKRIVLDEVGYFDPIFGLGYGEENDFCERAKAKEYKILCCDEAYVYHYGEASFSFVENIDERKKNNQIILDNRWPNYNKEVFAFCRLNPLREIQERVYHILHDSDKTNILHVIHNFDAPGGTELHTRTIIDGLADQYISTVIYPSKLGNLYVDAISKEISNHLRVVKVAQENNLAVEHFGGLPADLYSSVIEENFARFINGGNYKIVHFQHLSGWSTLLLPIIAKKMGKKVILSVHDFYLLCPEYNLLYPFTNQLCRKKYSDPKDKSCLYCLGTRRYNRYPEKAVALDEYLLERNHLISQVLESTDLLIAPSNFVKNKILSAFGSSLNEKITVIPHGIAKLEKCTRPQIFKKLHVGFLGNATDRKGINVFLKAVKLLHNQDFEFEIFGNTSPEIKSICSELKVKVRNGYKTSQLPKLSQKIDLVLLPTIFEETFSLTLSEAQSMGIAVLASDEGALKERIEDGKTGFLFKLGDASHLAEKLLFLKKNPQLIKNVQTSLMNLEVKTLEDNIEDYRNIYKKILSDSPSISNTTGKFSVHSLLPKTSLIVLTYNELYYTKLFYNSLNKHFLRNNELIIVDNASSDGTKEYLAEISHNKNIKVILNNSNLGFPAAVNQGILAAEGKYILIANNDIVLTEGWLERMIEIAESDPQIGLVGPLSNEVSGLQKDENAKYDSLDEMHNYAALVAAKNKGEVLHFPRVAFLCTLIKREVVEKVGGLDERFTPGNYEDDDYCLRAQIAGFKTVIAKDVFIHHFGSKSFKADGSQKYIEQLEVNKQKFIDKWGVTPDELWLQNKEIKPRQIIFHINKDQFAQHFERARVQIADKEFAAALNSFILAIQYYTASERKGYEIDYAWLLNLAGNTALLAGNIEVAKNYFEEELSLVPNSSSACVGLGEVFLALKMIENSKVMFEWSVKNDPENKTALQSLSKVNILLGLEEYHNSLN